GIHRDAGVELVTGDEVERFEGASRIERAITQKGRRLECDVVVIAVGIRPTVDVLQGTGVALDNGVLVDARCRTTVPGIFAAGDVANHLHPRLARTRLAHYNNAEQQVHTAVRAT